MTVCLSLHLNTYPNNVGSQFSSSVLNPNLFILFLNSFSRSQVKFWSQHISFILVGIIIVTSIRGLLITLTKVKLSHDTCGNGYRRLFLFLIMVFN